MVALYIPCKISAKTLPGTLDKKSWYQDTGKFKKTWENAPIISNGITITIPFLVEFKKEDISILVIIL